MECCMESCEQEAVRSQTNATRRRKRKRKGNPRRSPQSKGPRDNPDAWIARPPHRRESFVSSLRGISIDSKRIQESVKRLHFLANSKMQLTRCWWIRMLPVCHTGCPRRRTTRVLCWELLENKIVETQKVNKRRSKGRENNVRLAAATATTTTTMTIMMIL